MTMPGIPCRFQKFRDTLRGTLAQLSEQLPVIEEELAKDLWYAKNVLPVWNRKDDRFLEMMGKLNHFLTMT